MMKMEGYQDSYIVKLGKVVFEPLLVLPHCRGVYRSTDQISGEEITIISFTLMDVNKYSGQFVVAKAIGKNYRVRLLKSQEYPEFLL